jgi:hypothetical protein
MGDPKGEAFTPSTSSSPAGETCRPYAAGVYQIKIKYGYDSQAAARCKFFRDMYQLPIICPLTIY